MLVLPFVEIVQSCSHFFSPFLLFLWLLCILVYYEYYCQFYINIDCCFFSCFISHLMSRYSCLDLEPSTYNCPVFFIDTFEVMSYYLYYVLTVSCRSLVDGRGSLGSCKHRFIYLLSLLLWLEVFFSRPIVTLLLVIGRFSLPRVRCLLFRKLAKHLGLLCLNIREHSNWNN